MPCYDHNAVLKEVGEQYFINSPVFHYFINSLTTYCIWLLCVSAERVAYKWCPSHMVGLQHFTSALVVFA